MLYDQMFSADCHVVEPPDLFTTRVDAKHRDQAPGSVWGPLSDGREGEFYGLPGATSDRDLLAVAALAAAGVPDMMEANRGGFAGMPAYVRDPGARLEVQERDGVLAEVLYPSWGMFLYSVPDDALRRECFRVYNDWVGEFCALDTKRLLGAAGIDVAGPDSVPAAAAELERCAEMGLRPALIPCDPDPGHNYGMPGYDGLWAAAQDAGVPISFHILCNKDVYPFTSGGPGDTGPLDYYVNTIITRILSSVTHMITGGVFDRFPGLKVVISEADCSWIPHFLFRMDHFWPAHSPRLPLQMMPSEYFKRNCYTTFQWEGRANLPYAIDFVGADRLCWGSDFPHYDSTYPASKEVAAKAVAGFDDHTQRMLLRGATADLYGL